MAVSVTETQHEVATRLKVLTAFAERDIDLERAQVLCEATIKTADGLGQNTLGNWLRTRARTVRGFVLMRRGMLDEAWVELESSLQPIIKNPQQGVSPFTKFAALPSTKSDQLWLAELYELRGDYEAAAKFIVADYATSAGPAPKIRERLIDLYRRLGRPANAANTDLARVDAARSKGLTTVAIEEKRRRAVSNRLGKPAPQFALTTLEKKGVRFGDLKGRVVILNFWATWCGPCVQEMPHFQKVVDKYRANPNVVFVAVSIDENRPAVRPFIEKYGYTFPVAFDSDMQTTYNVVGIPVSVIIGRDGLIQYRDSGFSGSGDEYMQRLIWRIDALLSDSVSGR